MQNYLAFSFSNLNCRNFRNLFFTAKVKNEKKNQEDAGTLYSTIHNSWKTLFKLATNSSAMGVVNTIEHGGMHAKEYYWTRYHLDKIQIQESCNGYNHHCQTNSIENSNMAVMWSYLVSELKPIFWCKQLKGVQNLKFNLWSITTLYGWSVEYTCSIFMETSFCIDPSSYQGPTQSEKFHTSLLHQIHIHRNKEALIWCLLAFHPCLSQSENLHA